MVPRLPLTLAVLIALAVPASAAAQGSAPAVSLPGQVLAGGLDNPRGVVLSPGGVAYVAEAGRGGDGPCRDAAGGQRMCLGASGRVTRVSGRGTTTVMTGLPSLAAADGSGAVGPNDVARRGKRIFTLLGLGDRPSSRAALGELGMRLGWLFEAQDGRAKPLADIAGHAGDAVSHPFGMANVGRQLYVADAAANSVVVVGRGGALRTKATLPSRTLTQPDGTPMRLDAAPSAIGHAGRRRLYVAELTGFPFPKDEARVHRVDGGAAPSRVFASKFTNIVDIVPAGAGSMYVLEGSRGPGTGRMSGRLLHMEPGGRVRHIIATGLPSPGGLAVHPYTGQIYVTLNSDRAGEGVLVRIKGHGTNHASVGTPQGQYPDMEKATKRGIAEGTKLWQATLRAAPRFSFEKALRAGFRFTSKNPPPVPGVFHLRRDRYDRDGREMDPRRPESLVYYNTTAGEKVLVSFMYRAESQRFPQVTRGLLGWHRHGASARALPMTHVWLTNDLRSALANCLPVPELEQALAPWRFEGSSNRISGLESLPCGEPGAIVTG